MYIGKTLKRLITVSLIAGSLTFAPEVCHFSPMPVACAEVKTYEGVGEYVMSDFETPEIAKQRAKTRAEQNAQEQAGVYVNTYTKVKNFQLTDQEIVTITNGIMSIIDTHYDVIPDTDGFRFRATIKANIDSDEINKWLSLDTQDRAALVSRNEELQKAIAEQEKQIKELKEQLKSKNANENIDKLKTELNKADNAFLSNQKVDVGNRFYFKGDYNSAIANYSQAIELDSNNVTAYKNRGTSYANVKDYYQAAKDFSRAIELTPNDASAYIGRGASYIYLKQYDLAVADLTKAITINPNNAMAYYNRGVCYKLMNKFYQAQADFDRARQLGYRSS